MFYIRNSYYVFDIILSYIIKINKHEFYLLLRCNLTIFRSDDVNGHEIEMFPVRLTWTISQLRFAIGIAVKKFKNVLKLDEPNKTLESSDRKRKYYLKLYNIDLKK